MSLLVKVFFPYSHLKLYVSKTVANLLYFSKSNSAKGQGRVEIGRIPLLFFFFLRIPLLTPEFEHIKC